MVDHSLTGAVRDGAKELKRAVPLATALYHVLLNSLRWAIVGFLLVICLSAILALNETRSFQARVADLVGNDDENTRRVLVALHDIYANPEDYPEDPILPYPLLATELDRLSSVQVFLDGFSNVGDVPADGDQGVGGSAVENGSVDEATTQVESPDGSLFKLAVQKLEFTSKDLAQLLESRDPDIRTAKAINKMEADIAALERFYLTDETKTAEAGDSQDEPPQEQGATPHAASYSPSGGAAAEKNPLDINGYEAIFELEIVIDRLNDHVADLKQQVGLSGESNLVAEKLDELQLEIDGIETRYPANNLVHPGEAFDGKNGTTVDSHNGIQTLKMHVDKLKGTLLDVDDGFSAALELAGMVNHATALAERLSKIEPGSDIAFRQKPGGSEVEASAARAAFDDVRGQFSNVIEDMRDTLASRTSVVAVANVIPLGQDEAKDDRYERAHTILREFEAVGRFQGPLNLVGFDSYQVATMTRETLAMMFIFVVGAIGSVIFLTKCSIKHIFEGNALTDPPPWSIALYLFRPFFGIVVALAAYLLFKAGQLALGNSGLVGGAGDFNLPILSMIALFAGLLSWQALEAIETRGANWFRAQTRENLWATGLNKALQTTANSGDQLANNIGRSKDQVFRWVIFRDPVTPELQDRIANWLKRPLNELFSRDQPKRRALWFSKDFALHLLLAHKARDERQDARAGLERMGGQLRATAQPAYDTLMLNIGYQQTSPETAAEIAAWWAGTKAVPPAVQDRICAELNYPMQLLFDVGKSGPPGVSDQPEETGGEPETASS